MADARIARVRIVKNEYGEYVCKAYDANGKRLPNSDYYTNDKEDAKGTALCMVYRSK